MIRVEEIVRRHLIGVRTVHVQEDVNHDDEPILRVDVTYERGAAGLSAADMSAVIAELWDEALNSSARSFPVVNFIEAADVKEPAAA